ncbi:hypothetical protein [Rickettsia endosymbiont of Halotydeus destructor]|uniref:hypothetical protein n=1 Tax=Rickettsia endosymbiont of Halotydeus destructor TaxID=2996754 RepID=UPI003BB034B3
MRKERLLEKFGNIYIDFVRDSVLKGMEEIVNNEYNELMPNQLELLKIIVATTIDKTLHSTLLMLQEYEEEMQLIMLDEDYHERSLGKISDNLCEKLYGKDGWIKKYSKYPTRIEELENFN